MARIIARRGPKARRHAIWTASNSPVDLVGVTEVASGNDTLTGASDTITISGVTPVDGDTFVVAVLVANDSLAPSVTGVSGWGQTWTEQSAQTMAYRRRLAIFAANVSSSSPGDLTVSVTAGGTTLQDAAFKVVQLSNFDSFGAEIEAESGVNTLSQTLTLPGPNDSFEGDGVLSFIGLESSQPSLLCDWTKFGTDVGSANSRQLASAYLVKGVEVSVLDADANWTWGASCFSAGWAVRLNGTAGGASATAPAAPGTPTATAGNGQATVSWGAPSSGGSIITDYTVIPYIGASPQTSVPVAGPYPPTSKVVTGLSNGTEYTFKVTATNAIGTSAESAASNAVTPVVPTVPATPSAPTATAGDASASVSWSAPSDGGSPITSYTVTPYIGATPQTATTGIVTTNSVITGLSNSTEYTFTVKAINAVGTSGESSASNAVTPTAGAAPSVPRLSTTGHTDPPSSTLSGSPFFIIDGTVNYTNVLFNSHVAVLPGATTTLTNCTIDGILVYEVRDGASATVLTLDNVRTTGAMLWNVMRSDGSGYKWENPDSPVLTDFQAVDCHFAEPQAPTGSGQHTEAFYAYGWSRPRTLTQTQFDNCAFVQYGPFNGTATATMNFFGQGYEFKDCWFTWSDTALGGTDSPNGSAAWFTVYNTSGDVGSQVAYDYPNYMIDCHFEPASQEGSYNYPQSTLGRVNSYWVNPKDHQGNTITPPDFLD